MKVCLLLLFAIKCSICLQPGYGYSTDRENFANIACFNQQSEQFPPDSSIKIDKSSDKNEIQNLFSIGVTVKGHLGPISEGELGVNVSVLNKFIRETEDNDYSTSYYYYNKISRKTNFFFDDIFDINSSLTEDGLEVYQNNFEDFGIVCGDKFIESIEEIALFVINVKFVFDYKEDKDTFIHRVGLNLGPLFGFTATITNISRIFKGNIQIVITANQFGGSPQYLGKIYDGNNISECSIRSLDKCQNIISAISNYASGDFVRQIDNLQNFTLLGPGFTQQQSIEEIYLEVPPSYVDNTIKEAREKLKMAYTDLENAKIYLKNHPYDNLDAIKDLVTYNKLLYADKLNISNISSCFNDIENCVEKSKSFLRKYKPISVALKAYETKY